MTKYPRLENTQIPKKRNTQGSLNYEISKSEIQ